MPRGCVSVVFCPDASGGVLFVLDGVATAADAIRHFLTPHTESRANKIATAADAEWPGGAREVLEPGLSARGPGQAQRPPADHRGDAPRRALSRGKRQGSREETVLRVLG